MVRKCGGRKKVQDTNRKDANASNITKKKKKKKKKKKREEKKKRQKKQENKQANY